MEKEHLRALCSVVESDARKMLHAALKAAVEQAQKDGEPGLHAADMTLLAKGITGVLCGVCAELNNHVLEGANETIQDVVGESLADGFDIALNKVWPMILDDRILKHLPKLKPFSKVH